jgi:hypothetical protein
MSRKCYTHLQISEALGVHRTTVTRTLTKIHRRALKRLEAQTAALKAQQVEQLCWIAEQIARQWERSCEDSVTVQETSGHEMGVGADGNLVGLPGEVKTTTKGQSGNPALAKEMRSALADIRSILGIDAKLDIERARLAQQQGESGAAEADPAVAAAALKAANGEGKTPKGD